MARIDAGKSVNFGLLFAQLESALPNQRVGSGDAHEVILATLHHTLAT
jgi:hypothetical protein